MASSIEPIFMLCIWLPNAKKLLVCFVTHMLCVVEYSFCALWMTSQLRCVMKDGCTCSRLSRCFLRVSPCMWSYTDFRIFLFTTLFLIISCHWLPYSEDYDGGRGVFILVMRYFAPWLHSQFNASHLSSCLF